MYKYKSGQISITDFGQPMGMHLNENNRWVKKAAMIPWNEIEKRYAGLFKSHKGNPAKPLRLALGACMIQDVYKRQILVRLRIIGGLMKSTRQNAKRLILALYNIDEAYYASEKKKRLSDAELCIMYALDDGQPHSQKEICEEWLVPKTTVNTITKKWEAQGYLTLAAIPGKRREMQITLTDSGKAYAKEFMAFVYRAEDKALAKTLDKYSDTFIEALEFFGASLKEAFEEDIKNGSSQG